MLSRFARERWSARFLWHCVVLAAIATPCSPAQEPQVQVARKLDAIQVQAAIPVAVDAATAWRVLTDYNRLADFVPDMHVSRIVSEPGQAILLEQHGDAGFLVFRVGIRVVLQIEESPPDRIAFRAVSGNMKRMQGEWRVVRDGGAIVLSYQAEMAPEFWVPPLIGDALLKGHVERQILGVVKEMLRRHGADGVPVAPKYPANR